ncbi:MAG: alkaline phosphatase family protein [Bacteroidaceae bacterium]|nr:alkaline phosphatase family protein [Bacteroidaceae bacterium]MBR1521400.1 alkaline phosphatase family protein [Bacteroidaceae bacterium]
MKKQILTTFIASVAVAGSMAQTTSVPRLVVGISIDQLRSDYLNAFMPLYGDGGFKLLLEKGQVYSNVQYQHTPVDRASAIATIVTGTVPYNHGIIAEEWMSRTELHTNYCVDDHRYKGVETNDFSSPKNLLVSTIGDELKAATKGKALVYSVAPYREAAILAAGHAADWAMWIDNQNGKWAGTTYYGEAPAWMRYLESGSIADRLSSMAWKPSNESTGAYNYYLTTTQKPFSHNFTGDSRFRMFKTSGLVNEEVTKAAKYCMESGNVGMDEVTDFLSVCYYAGNFDGATTATTELQDTYKRLDDELAKLLKRIDELVGLDRTLVYVTSTGYDEVDDAEDLAKYRIPTGEFNINRCATLLNMYLCAMFGNGQYVESYFGNQVYLNHKLLEQKQLKLAEVLEHCEDFLFQFSGVRDVFTAHRITQGAWTPGISGIRNGFNPKCSGDIIIQVQHGWNLVNEDRGTKKLQRDSFFEFPLIFLGYTIQAEKVATPVTVDCIAPTVAHHIRIRAPNGCSASPLF